MTNILASDTTIQIFLVNKSKKKGKDVSNYFKLLILGMISILAKLKV